MYWNRCSPNATRLTTRGTTLNVQLRLQLSSTKTRTPFASPRRRHRRSRALLGRSRASRRINRALVLRSALDEALEETLRFSLVAARTDFTLAQALSLGVLEVPMFVVWAALADAASPCAARQLSLCCPARRAALRCGVGQAHARSQGDAGCPRTDARCFRRRAASRFCVASALRSAETAPCACGRPTRSAPSCRCDDDTTMDTYNKLHRDHIVA